MQASWATEIPQVINQKADDQWLTLQLIAMFTAQETNKEPTSSGLKQVQHTTLYHQEEWTTQIQTQQHKMSQQPDRTLFKHSQQNHRSKTPNPHHQPHNPKVIWSYHKTANHSQPTHSQIQKINSFQNQDQKEADNGKHTQLSSHNLNNFYYYDESS